MNIMHLAWDQLDVAVNAQEAKQNLTIAVIDAIGGAMSNAQLMRFVINTLLLEKKSFNREEMFVFMEHVPTAKEIASLDVLIFTN